MDSNPSYWILAFFLSSFSLHICHSLVRQGGSTLLVLIKRCRLWRKLSRASKMSSMGTRHFLVAWKSNAFLSVGSGGGSVGRVVASNTRGRLFESQHWQNFIYQLYISKEKTKIKKKRWGMAHLFKNLLSVLSWLSRMASPVLCFQLSTAPSMSTSSAPTRRWRSSSSSSSSSAAWWTFPEPPRSPSCWFEPGPWWPWWGPAPTCWSSCSRGSCFRQSGSAWGYHRREQFYNNNHKNIITVNFGPLLLKRAINLFWRWKSCPLFTNCFIQCKIM